MQGIGILVKRRNFLKAAAAGLLGSAFVKSPGVLANQRRPAFELTASNGRFKFGPDQAMATQVMFYNQSIPGPVIRIPQGQESTIQFKNALDESSSVHWHGLRIDNVLNSL